MTFIRYEVRDAVAEILIDNPPVNALTDEVMDELIAALQRARHDDAARAVVLASATPGRFCAGLDLGVFRKLAPADVHRLVDKVYTQLCDVQFGLGKPSIAAIRGAVRGGGMTVAISCDLIVAADDASFGYPEIDIGLLPAIHFTHLPRLVGRHRAFELLFSGRPFKTAEAVDMGLVCRAVPDDQVLAAAHALARTLAAKSPQLMRMGKNAFVRAIDSDYRRGVAGAVDLTVAVFGTEDSKEALTAFVEKRKPVWKA